MVPKRIVIIFNSNKEGSSELADKLAEMSHHRGISARVCGDYPIPCNTLSNTDLCCVIGGDGTILGVVEESAKHKVPVIGINHGKLGFLATCSQSEVESRFEELLSGEIKISPRSLLQCKGKNKDKIVALNDIVIKSNSPRLLRALVYANNTPVNEYAADGLVFSTPTGSTAYNLSAGGPLIQTDAPVVALTPICPHTLSNRSVIFSQETELKVELIDKSTSIRVSKDGQDCNYTAKDFPLTIKTTSNISFPLIVNPKQSHYKLIHNKLHWGNDVINT